MNFVIRTTNLTQQSLKDIILKRKCVNHPDFQSDMLLLDPNSKQHRICSKCMKEIKLLDKLIPIPDILKWNYSYDEQIFPMLDMEDGEELKKMLKIQLDINEVCCKVEDYYLELQKDFEVAIKEMISKDCERIKKQITEWNQQNKKLKSFLSMKSFVQKLMSNDQDSEKQLHEYIVKRHSYIQRDMKEIKNTFNQVKEFLDSFSKQQALLIQSDILKKFQNINLFADQSEQQTHHKVDSTSTSYSFLMRPVSSQYQRKTFSSSKSLIIDLKPNLSQSQKKFSICNTSGYPLNLNTEPSEQMSEIPEIPGSIIGKVTCLPSKFYNSDQNISIQQVYDQIQIKNINPGKDPVHGQCYLLPEIQANKNYLIQLCLNNQSYNTANFYFGLIDQQQKDNWHISSYDYNNEYNNENAFYQESSGGYCTQVIKGQQLHSNNAKRIGTKKLEFRINLSEKIFKVSSPPNYKNVVQLSSKEYFRNKSYLFAIDIENPGDYVTIESIQELQSFNKKM